MHAAMDVRCYQAAPFGIWPCSNSLSRSMFFILIAFHAKKTQNALLIVFLTQVPVWIVLHAWVEHVAMFGWIGLGLYMSIWAPLFVLLLRRVQTIPVSIIFTAPMLWVGLECLRGIVIFDGYPWYLAGTGIVDWSMASIATVGSVWIVSFLVVLIAATLATAKQVKWWTWLFLTLFCFYISATPWGDYMRAPSRNITDVIVIQTNVSQDNKVAWTWERQMRDVTHAIDLTYMAIEQAEVKPSLIIWPETMLPGSGFEVDRLDFGPRGKKPLLHFGIGLQRFAKSQTISIYRFLLVLKHGWISKLLKGVDVVRVEPSSQFNSAVLVYPNGTTERYDKSFLTPFGERIPYVEQFPSLQEWIREQVGSAMLFDLNPGGETHRFSLPTSTVRDEPTEWTFATPICFEDTVPSVVRNLIWENGDRKAGALVNLSNDGWFSDDASAHMQHVREARMRCIENMTPMVRAANTGISCFIGSNGKVQKELPIGEHGILPIQLHSGFDLPKSRYVGDSVAWFCLFGSILLVVCSFKKSEQQP